MSMWLSSSEEHVIAFNTLQECRAYPIDVHVIDVSADIFQEIQETYPASQLLSWSGRHSVISDPYTKKDGTEEFSHTTHTSFQETRKTVLASTCVVLTVLCQPTCARLSLSEWTEVPWSVEQTTVRRIEHSSFTIISVPWTLTPHISVWLYAN